MFKTLRIIKMVTLFFILSGFAAPSFNEEITNVLNKLNSESASLVAEFTQQNNELANEARSLSKIISVYKASMSGSKTELSSTEIFCLWLHYGELYRKASQQTNFATGSSKRILIKIKGHMNVLLKINGKRV